MIEKISLKIIIGFVFIAVFLFSCNTGVLIDKFKKIENGIWRSTDVVRFSVDIPDTLQPYNFYFNIRNSSDYAYANIFLFLKTFYPDGKISIDTLECVLAQPDGKWLGSGKKMIDHRILFRKKIKFPQPGRYTFEFEQAMREEELKGIINFGIRIEKYKEQDKK